MTAHRTNEFEAAKAVTEALEGLDKAQQERAIRWASETLGLHAASSRAATSGPTAVTTVAENVGYPQSEQNSQTDIRTFVRSKSPKSDMQLATAVAYFYKFLAPQEERKESIAGSDLSEAIRQIGNWTQPKRPDVTLQNAKKQGYLDSAARGRFRLNSVGENLVTMTLGPNGEGEAAPRKPRKKKTAKKSVKKKSR